MSYLYMSAPLTIVTKPKWVDGFRKKYDEPRHFHVSLKRAARILKKDEPKVKQLAAEIAKRHKAKTLTFSKIFFGESPSGHYIMMAVEPNKEVQKLLKDCYTTFLPYAKYVHPENAEHDKQMKTHLTIGRRLTPEQFKKAKAELPKKVKIVARLNTIALALNPSSDSDYYDDPRFLTKYRLQKDA